MKTVAPPMKPHVLKSILLHSCAILLICFALYSAHSTIEDQEQAFLEDLKAQEEALEQEEREAAEELLKEELAEQIEDEFEAVIEQELDAESAEQLQDALSEQLEDWVEEAAEDMPLHEMSNEELTALSEQLREMSLEELQKQLEEMKKEMLLSMVREKIEKEVAPDIKRNIEQELKKQTGKQLKTNLERQAKKENAKRLQELRKELDTAKKEIKEIRDQQDKQVHNQANKDKVEEAKTAQEDVEKKLAAVNERIDQTIKDIKELAPKTKNLERLEKNLETVSKEVKESKESLEQADKNKQRKETKEVVHQLDQTQREIQALSNQLKHQERSRELTDIDKQAIDEILPEVEKQVREEVTKAVTEESVPLAAKKLTKVLESQLEKLQLNNDEFKQTLEKEIKDALAKDFEKEQAKSETASLQSKEMIQRRSSEDIKQAREEIKEALAKLEAVNKEQKSLKEETIRETAAKDAQAELQIKSDISEAKQDAKKALDEASAVTLKMDNALKYAQRDISDDKAEKHAKNASDYVKREIVDEAKKSMEAVNNELEKKINKLKEVDKGLAKEQEALEKMEAVATDLKKLLGDESSEELKENMEKAAEEGMDALARKDVKTGTEKTKMDDSLDGIEMLEAMQELGETMAESAADGRMLDNAGELMGEMEEGLLGPGQGAGGLGGPGGNQLRYGGLNQRGYGFFNRKLYEEFSKDMRERLNPKKAYEEQEEKEGLHSTADKRDGEAAATMVVLKGKNSKTKAADEKTTDEKRSVPKPGFHTIAYGAADYAIDPITIDGDLKDWGELRHPQKHKMDLKANAVDGPEVFMRWSPKGLYFCYTRKTDQPINSNGPAMWQCTGMELFVDVRNRRKDRMEESPTSQQIFFCPFGWRNDPKMTFGESGRGHRGLKKWTLYPDGQGLRGKAAAKLIPGGYQVECFIKKSNLGHPVLTPGMYLAINHSVNLGNAFETQWSAPKSVHTWNRPDTWGDVLLLGSDARVAFKNPEDKDVELQGVLPGDPVRVEITDPDMNLYELKADRVMATVKVEGTQAPVMLVLKETKANSGVFAGAFSTQAYFKPAAANTLNIRGGNSIILSYTDARAGYGEKNRKVTASIAVGWPVTELE